MDFLKSAVASAISKGPLGGYTLGDRVDLDKSVWTLHNAVRREGDVRCSVFQYDISAGRSRLPIAKNAVRKSRTLHHPNVIKILDTIETESHIYLITERLTPLEWFTRRKSLSEETMKWGLWTIATAVKFINEEASSVHGCIRASSVFVGDSGEWKLGGFDILSSMNDADAVIYKCSSLVPDLGRYMPPEVGQGGWEVIKKAPLSAPDSFGYGALVAEVFNGTWSGSDVISQARGLPPSMQQNFKRLMNPNPKVRLSVAHFLEQGRRSGGFFQTPLITISEGIDNLGLKSEGERVEFLKDLEEISDQFPDDYMKRKVLPELVKSIEFGGGGPQVFNVVLQIGTKLSSDEYDSLLIPVLIRLFGSPDRALRVCLLDNLPLMIDHLSQKLVNDKVFPNMITGFTDMAPIVREQTVKAVLVIAPKLADRTINGELLKYLAKTANDEQPGIRTNTTICLGKLAKFLNNNTRTKVLVAAFTRSLRDPFIHARDAALMALAATSDVFTAEDSANRIVPCISPSLLDKEKVIRDQASKTLEIYMQKIRNHAQTMPDTALPPTSATGDTSAPRATAAASAASDSTWTGWAISSFTNKLAAATGEIQPNKHHVSNPISNGSSRPSSSLGENAPSSSTINGAAQRVASGERAAPRLSRQTTDTSTSKIAQSFVQPEVADANGFWDTNASHDHSGEFNDDEDFGGAWGEMGDMDEDEDGGSGTGNAAAQSAASATAAAAASSTRSGAARPAPAATNDGEPDFAAWLTSRNTTKKKNPLPKGLSKATSASSAPRKPLVTRTAGTAGTMGSGPKSTSQAKAGPPSASGMDAASRAGQGTNSAKEADNDDFAEWAQDDDGDAWA